MSGAVLEGVAWAIQVKPDLLLEHTIEFESKLPAIHTLRLCHRFGRGADVHVNRLPVELVLKIEQLVLDASYDIADDRGLRASRYACYESRCHPVDHAKYACPEALQEVEKCDACAGDSLHERGCSHACKPSDEDICGNCQKSADYLLCEKSCYSTWLKQEEALWLIAPFAERREYHDRARRCWELDCKWLEHAFSVGDELSFRKYFGLEVFVAHSRDTIPPDHPKWDVQCEFRRGDNRLGPRRITLCYLILPRIVLRGKSHYPGDETNTYRPDIDVGKAIARDLQSSEEARKRDLRFRRAMRVLGLMPYVPATKQPDPAFDAYLSNEATHARPDDNNAKEQLQSEGDLAAVKPKLLMLSKPRDIQPLNDGWRRGSGGYQWSRARDRRTREFTSDDELLRWSILCRCGRHYEV